MCHEPSSRCTNCWTPIRDDDLSSILKNKINVVNYYFQCTPSLRSVKNGRKQHKMAAASDGRVEEVRGIRQRSASDSQILIQANGRPNQYQHQQSVDDMASSRKRLTFFQRLLRPWKWRRKKKSKKFVETSQSKFNDWLVHLSKRTTVKLLHFYYD